MSESETMIPPGSVFAIHQPHHDFKTLNLSRLKNGGVSVIASRGPERIVFELNGDDIAGAIAFFSNASEDA